MVTGKWEQGTNLMPSGTEVTHSIAIESTKVTSHEGQTEELVLVDVLDRGNHVLNPRPVVTEPVIGILLQSLEV